MSKFMAHQNGEKGSYNDTELRDMIVNFMLAGRDTTAATMSWFVYRMCCLPEVADKIYEEGVRVIGKHESFESAAECLRHDTLAKMHYLHAAIEESIRLHPPVSRVRTYGDYNFSIDHLSTQTIFEQFNTCLNFLEFYATERRE